MSIVMFDNIYSSNQKSIEEVIVSTISGFGLTNMHALYPLGDYYRREPWNFIPTRWCPIVS